MTALAIIALLVALLALLRANACARTPEETVLLWRKQRRCMVRRGRR